MPYGYSPLQIRAFGGLNTLYDPTNLPAWASPDCSDVEFLPGLVRTRPGLSSQFATLGGGTVTVNYLKTYINSLLQNRMLAFTPGLASLSNAGGVLYKENPEGTLNIVSQTLSSNWCSSCSAFTREYLAFGDGKFGVDIPRQFDDTNLDRVSQEGPGQAPSAIDESGSYTITASPNGVVGTAYRFAISAISESGFIATMTIPALPADSSVPKVGDLVQISGVTPAGYNGTWPVVGPVTPGGTSLQVQLNVQGLGPGTVFGTVDLGMRTINTTTAIPFVIGMSVSLSGVTLGGYNGTAQVRQGPNPPSNPAFIAYSSAWLGLADSGGGTVSPAGNIIAGVHQVSVFFQDREGYLTRPAPPAKWTASGGKRVNLSAIPTGPPNIVARIVCFTAVAGSSFFYVNTNAQMFSANMVITDNTTTSLTVDFSDAVLLSGTNADALFDLVVLGECAGVLAYSSRLFWWGERNQLQNLLNVGFDGGFTNPGTLPNFPYGWVQDATFSPGGASALAQGYPVYSGNAYAIVGNGGTPTRGKMTQTLYQDYLGNPILSANTSYSIRVRLARNSTLATGTLHINASSASGAFTTTGISVTPSQLATWYQEFTAVLLTAQTTIPSDLVLQVYADGTPTLNGAFLLDNIEIYPTNQPNSDASTIRASKVEDPESYDGVSGFLQVAQGDGQAVRSAFVLRNILYFVKERSLYATADDGTNEPNVWTIQEISAKVGTPSVRGVGLGDEWAIIAAQEGVYYFNGGEPQKISQEIQPTWDSINWAFGYLISVVVDTKRKRVYVSAPFGTATSPNKILTLDYTEGFAEAQDGVGRKWSPWAIQANSMNLILRADGTLPLFIGNGAGNGTIYKLNEAAFSDDGSAINSYWQSGYLQDVGRLVFGPLVANVVGSGSCNLVLRKGDQGWITNLRPWTLSNLGFHNMERTLNIETERLAVRFGTNAAGDHFSLQGLQLYAKESTWAPLRGVNV